MPHNTYVMCDKCGKYRHRDELLPLGQIPGKGTRRVCLYCIENGGFEGGDDGTDPVLQASALNLDRPGASRER
jgi:hypothetical protein